MNVNESLKFREMIEKAIEDHIITHQEYDQIIHMATSDGNIDVMEQALLAELQRMLQDGMIKFRNE